MNNNDTPHPTTVPTSLLKSRLPVAYTTALRWCKAGRVPGAKRIGFRWFVTPEALVAAFNATSKDTVRNAFPKGAR